MRVLVAFALFGVAVSSGACVPVDPGSRLRQQVALGPPSKRPALLIALCPSDSLKRVEVTQVGGSLDNRVVWTIQSHGTTRPGYRLRFGDAPAGFRTLSPYRLEASASGVLVRIASNGDENRTEFLLSSVPRDKSDLVVSAGDTVKPYRKFLSDSQVRCNRSN